MAQNFSRINWDDYKGWDIPVYIHRLNAIPLDKTAFYYSYEEALSYVQDENNVCYPGQLITVIDEENSKITIYKTNLDRTLSEITEGSSGSVAENVYTKEEVDAKIEEALSRVQSPIVILTRDEWNNLNDLGQVVPDRLYGIIESGEGPVNPDVEGGNVELDIEGGTITFFNAVYNESLETLEVEGIYDPDTDTLTLISGNKAEDKQNIVIENDTMTVDNVMVENDKLSIEGIYDSADEALILTI